MNSSTSTRKSQKIGRKLRSGKISLNDLSKNKPKLSKKEKNGRVVTEESTQITMSNLGCKLNNC